MNKHWLCGLLAVAFVQGCATVDREAKPTNDVRDLKIAYSIRDVPVGGAKSVGPDFIQKTREWRDYLKQMEGVSWERIVTLEGSFKGQVNYYLHGCVTKVTWTSSEGSGIPQRIQWYRDGQIYILLVDLNEDGKVDACQFYTNGNPSYTEAASRLDGRIDTWW